MGAAQQYTLFTLFILFKLLYTVNSSVYAILRSSLSQVQVGENPTIAGSSKINEDDEKIMRSSSLSLTYSF